MTSSGIDSIDELLGGSGFPSKSAVVILGPLGRIKDAFGYRFLESGLSHNEFGLYITKLSASEILRDAEAMGIDIEKRPPYWIAGEGSAIPYSSDMIKLSVSIKDVLKKNGEKRLRIVFDQISPLLAVNQAESVYRFLEQLIFEVKRYDAILFAVLHQEMHSPAVVASIEQLFDGVLEVNPSPSGASETFIFKVKKMRGVSLKADSTTLSGISFMKVSETEKQAKTVAKETKRLVVLPFSSMSPDPGDDYFADGMTEEMISVTSRISGLSVISRISAMKFKGAEKTAREIAHELNVNSILEGSVRKAGDKLRISVQLIDAIEDENLWSEVFDREFRDIFSIQTEIAEKVAGSLKSRLLEDELVILKSRGAENLEAYTMYLKGRYLWNKRTKEATQDAIDLYNKALEIDSRYARAFAGLADCYFTAVSWRFMDFEEGIPKAREFAKRALEINDSLPEPHATMGPLLILEKKYDLAEKELKQAISLNPDYATAHLWYAFFLRVVGRLNEGLKENARACELDPLSTVNLWHYYLSLFYSGSIDEAITTCQRAIELEPSFSSGHLSLANFFARKENKEEAFRSLGKFFELTKNEYYYKLCRAEFEAIWGNKEQALQILDRNLPLPDENSIGSQSSLRADQYHELTLHAVLGDNDGFFKWMDWLSSRPSRYYEMVHIIPALRYDPLLSNIRADPRSKLLFARHHLTL